MKEHPILFNGEMVRAIIEGRKTQTSRVIKPQPGIAPGIGPVWKGLDDIQEWLKYCPYGFDGDKLWVRESIEWDQEWGWVYSADQVYVEEEKENHRIFNGDRDYIPSIHMPRCASRINLLIKEIRVERVQDITEDDAEAEGVKPYTAPAEMPAYKPAFADLWDLINEKRGLGWDVNPWVWVITFEKI